MTTMFKRILVALCISWVTVPSVHAEPVSMAQAQTAVQNWMSDPGNTLEADFANKGISSAITYSDANGTPAFYCVSFEQGGFVVTSTDDGVLPIVAFSESGALDPNPNNPLWVLLNDDMPKRTHVAQTLQREFASGMGMKSVLDPEITANQRRWQTLLGDGMRPLGIYSVSDVRVNPLVQSKWDQSTVSGQNVYNYYTPNKYVCGCVATAMAQLMRFHQHPIANVMPQTKKCYVDGSPRNLTMKGGTYAWGSMPLVPNASVTLAQRQAIGKLTYDAGVSVNMEYAPDGSGAYTGLASSVLPLIFGYRNAMGYTSSTGIDASTRQRAILPNLDGGHPVILGISGASGGHAIVADGYGYSSSLLYVHLNMGWSGSHDAWYNLPTVDGSGFSFNSLQTLIYNVFSTETGEWLSGRVIDSSGVPIAGATVTAVRLGTTVSGVTNAKGIYALRVAVGGANYTVTATSLGGSSSRVVSVPKSISMRYEENGYYYPTGASVGNSWGNNFTLIPVPVPVAPRKPAASDGTVPANVSISWPSVRNATRYAVYRATSSSGAKTMLGSTTGMSYNDSTAIPGVLYCYWITASNSAGTSAFSLCDEGYRKLSPPQGLSATTTDSEKITLSWAISTGASHYRVSRTDVWGDTATVLSDWQTARSFADTSCIAGRNYYYFVEAAVDGTGLRPSDSSSFPATGFRVVVSFPPASPEISGVALKTDLGTQGFQFDFQGQAGRNYAIQRTDSLKNPEWSTVMTVTAPADGIQAVTVPIPADKPFGFFRVGTPE